MKNIKSKVSISNVEIEIGGKVIKMTLDEVRELKDVLNDLFPQPTYIPSQPIIIDRRRYDWPWRTWEYSAPYCGSVTADDTLRLTYSSTSKEVL